MISMLLHNIKALVWPKEFINLAYRKVWMTVVYVLIMSFITSVLFSVQFTNGINNLFKYYYKIIEEHVSDFTYDNGVLSVNDDETTTVFLEDGSVLVFVTSLEKFSEDIRDKECFIHYLDKKQYNQAINGVLRAYMFSKTKCVIITGENYQIFTYSELFKQGKNASIMQHLTKQELQEVYELPTFQLYIIFVLFFAVGFLIQPFKSALLVGLIMKIVNSFVSGKYSYGYMYRSALFIMVPYNLIFYLGLGGFYNKLVNILITLSSDPMQGTVNAMDHILSTLFLMLKISCVLYFVYPIAAVLHKVWSEGPFRNSQSELNDIRYMPGGYAVGNFDDGGNDMFSSKPFDPIPPTPQAPDNQPKQNTGYNPNPAYSATSQPNQNMGYTPNPVYSMNNQPSQNTGYNPNPAYSGGNQPKQNTGYNPNPAYSAANQSNTYAGYNQTPVYHPEANQHTNTGYNPNPAYSSTSQPINNMYSPEPEEEMDDDNEYTDRSDLAQDNAYAEKGLVWKKQEQRNSRKPGQQAYTSQQWRPQAYTDMQAERKKWSEINQTWNPNQKSNFNQEWRPQAQTDMQSEMDKWNASNQKWNADKKVSFNQEWNPQKADNKEDPFGGVKQDWQKNQTWKGVKDTSNPTMGNGTSQTDGQNSQWNRTPVWGKKDDPFA